MQCTSGCIHGRPQKFFRGRQSRHYAYPFQVADDEMQRDVLKRFTVSTPQRKRPMLQQQITKMRFVGSNSQINYDNLYQRGPTPFGLRAIL